MSMDKQTNSFLEDAKLIHLIDSGLSELKSGLSQKQRATDKLLLDTNALLTSASKTIDEASETMTNNAVMLSEINTNSLTQVNILNKYIKQSKKNKTELDKSVSSIVVDINDMISTSVPDDELNYEEARELADGKAGMHDDIETILELLEYESASKDDTKRSFKKMSFIGGIFSSVKSMIGQIPGLGPLLAIGGIVGAGSILKNMINDSQGDGFIGKAMEPFFEIFGKMMGGMFSSIGEFIACQMKKFGEFVVDTIKDQWAGFTDTIDMFVDDVVNRKLKDLGLLGIKNTLEDIVDFFRINGGVTKTQEELALSQYLTQHTSQVPTEDLIQQFGSMPTQEQLETAGHGLFTGSDEEFEKMKNDAILSLTKKKNTTTDKSRIKTIDKRIREIANLKPTKGTAPSLPNFILPEDFTPVPDDDSGKIPTIEDLRPVTPNNKPDSGGVVVPQYESPAPMPSSVRTKNKSKLTIAPNDIKYLADKMAEELNKDKKPKHTVANISRNSGRTL